MGDQRDGGIAWTDVTWNPVRGCLRVSPGCENCYAERIAARFSGPGQPYEGLARIRPAIVDETTCKTAWPATFRWTGEVRLVHEHLADPLRWRRPRRVFVNSMSDLFHEKLTNEEIAAVFGVMAAAPQHTFQVLTKRPERMRAWFRVPGIERLVETLKHVALAGRIEEYVSPERVVEVPGWPGYFVTSKGRVLSDRTNHGTRGTDRHEVAPLADGEHGHRRVMLYPGGARVLVHRLMLDVFVRPGRDGEQACHIDGDPGNNALWNLRWGSHADNWEDSRRHGTHRRYSKLTEDQAAEIRARHAAGESGAALGRAFGISDTQARNIATGRQWVKPEAMPWPLPSVWIGVTAEDQRRADERIPLLLETPAAVRFVSVEPQLERVDLDAIQIPGERAGLRFSALRRHHDDRFGSSDVTLDWVICGAESGPGARPFDEAWARSLRDQCHAAGVPFFYKQTVVSGRKVSTPELDGRRWVEFPR